MDAVFNEIIENSGNEIPIPPPLPALPNVLSLDSINVTRLLNACETGDIETLSDIIPERLGQDYINFTHGVLNKTLLHIATKEGHANCVQFLLENKANVNCVDKRGKTPANVASACGCLQVLRILIKHGAELNKRDKFGRNCLHWATLNNHIECVRELIKSGAEVICVGNWQPLHEAAKAGYNDIIKVLVEAGCDVKNPTKYPSPGRPWSPLHVACRQGNIETVKLLLSLGANVNTCNGGGHSPLHEAAYRGYDDILLELLKNGAKRNATSNQLRTPLHEACIEGKASCAALLLDAGSNIHAQDLVMNTPLHYAVKSTRITKETKLKTIETLLKYGSKCSILGSDNETAIDAASANYFLEAVEAMKESYDIPRSLTLFCKIIIRRFRFSARGGIEDFKLLHLPVSLISYIEELE